MLKLDEKWSRLCKRFGAAEDQGQDGADGAELRTAEEGATTASPGAIPAKPCETEALAKTAAAASLLIWY